MSLGSVTWKKSTHEEGDANCTSLDCVDRNVCSDDHWICLVDTICSVVDELVHVSVCNCIHHLSLGLDLLWKACHTTRNAKMTVQLGKSCDCSSAYLNREEREVFAHFRREKRFQCYDSADNSSGEIGFPRESYTDWECGIVHWKVKRDYCDISGRIHSLPKSWSYTSNTAIRGWRVIYVEWFTENTSKSNHKMYTGWFITDKIKDSTDRKEDDWMRLRKGEAVVCYRSMGSPYTPRFKNEMVRIVKTTKRKAYEEREMLMRKDLELLSWITSAYRMLFRSGIWW